MTERGLPIDGAPACPFVAFEDDRDERASSPDHRHRCYAEANPAPRALAHQEAYCLSSAFPVCPTFQDWAKREAARSRGESPDRADPSAAPAFDQAQRNPPRNWAEPPPWMVRRAQDADDDRWERDDDDDGPPHDRPDRSEHADQPEDEEVEEAARGLSGSFADRVVTGGAAGAGASAGGGYAASATGAPDDAEDDATPFESREPAGTWQASPPPPSPQAGPPPTDAEPSGRPHRERQPGRVAAYDPPPFQPPRQPPRQPTRPSRAERRDSGAPEWERARPMEAFPTLRARRLPELSVPPILVSVIALALAAAVLFALPGLLGFGNPGSNPSPSTAPRPSPTVAVSLAPTPVPAPTQQVYIVQSGDTMSRIANRFDIPLDVLIAANEETIPNPDQLAIGDEVIIPVVEPSDVPSE
jgi:hypothetical protein